MVRLKGPFIISTGANPNHGFTQLRNESHGRGGCVPFSISDKKYSKFAWENALKSSREALIL